VADFILLADTEPVQAHTIDTRHVGLLNDFDAHQAG